MTDETVSEDDKKLYAVILQNLSRNDLKRLMPLTKDFGDPRTICLQEEIDFNLDVT